MRDLVPLTLGLDRGSDDHFGLLEIADGARAAGTHRGAKGADEILATVGARRRSEHRLLERRVDADLDARAARQLAVWCRHAPVVAASRRFLRRCQNRTQHDSVCAGGERLAYGAAVAQTAVRDDRHVASGVAVVGVARGGGVDRRGHLRHADAEHFAARARRARSDADEYRGDAGFHQLFRRGERHGVADDHRYVAHVLHEFVEDEALLAGRDVARAGDGCLHDEDIDAGVGSDAGELLRVHGRGRNGGDTACGLDLLDALADEVRLDRRRVHLLHQRRDIAFRCFSKFAQHRIGIFVARLHALKVQDSKTAELGELGGHPHIHDTIHRCGNERQREIECAELEREFYEAGVDGVVAARHDRDIVETVGATHLFELWL